jgi:hypothetical protein
MLLRKSEDRIMEDDEKTNRQWILYSLLLEVIVTGTARVAAREWALVVLLTTVSFDMACKMACSCESL